MVANGTFIGGWNLNTADNQFLGLIADYDGDGAAEIFVSSAWGIGVLKLSGGALTAPVVQPNGTRFGGWLLNTADNDLGRPPTTITTALPRCWCGARGDSAS